MTESINYKKYISLIYILSSIILGITAIFLLVSIIIINILNIPLLILVIFFIIGIVYGSIFLLFKSKIKRIGLGITVILTLLFSILISYINKTTNFLSSINLTYKTYNYLVVVRNNTYKELNDIKELGYIDDDSLEGDKALKKIKSKVYIDSIGYRDSYSLVKALLKNEVDAILIENSYLEILNENISLDNIENIYNFKVTINTSNILNDLDVTSKPFNIYLSGVDTYGSISNISRSDVNMVISINPKTKQILVTSIPRDYYVKLHGKTGYRDKLTHAGLYGIDTSIGTIEDLLDCDINYYVKVNFSSVIDIVEALDGIKVYSDYTFTSRDNYHYSKGYNQLNGEETLSFARERKAFLVGDRQRVKNQQEVFKAILDECLSKDIISKYTNLLDSLEGSFVTNMPMSRISSLIRMQLTKNYDWNIVMNCLEGHDSNNYTYSNPTQTSYVMTYDENSVLYGSKLIDSLTEGELLDEELLSNLKANIMEEDAVTVSSYTSDNKLRAKLVRSMTKFTLGEDYIYHGYSAMYDGKDITGNSNIKEKFTINGKTYDNYLKLFYLLRMILNSKLKIPLS